MGTLFFSNKMKEEKSVGYTVLKKSTMSRGVHSYHFHTNFFDKESYVGVICLADFSFRRQNS